jgi:hypothetical protein
MLPARNQPQLALTAQLILPTLAVQCTGPEIYLNYMLDSQYCACDVRSVNDNLGRRMFSSSD